MKKKAKIQETILEKLYRTAKALSDTCSDTCGDSYDDSGTGMYWNGRAKDELDEALKEYEEEKRKTDEMIAFCKSIKI